MPGSPRQWAHAGAPNHPHPTNCARFSRCSGVIVGTGTIIGVGAILTGFDANIAAVLRSFGPNSIIVFKFPVGPRMTELTPEERTRKDLTYQNALRYQGAVSVGAGCFPDAVSPIAVSSTSITKGTTSTT